MTPPTPRAPALRPLAAVLLVLSWSTNASGSEIEIVGEVVASVPMSTPFHVPFVEARIDGSEPLNFLVDTGAGSFLLDDATAKRLGLEPENVRQARLVGGAARVGSLDGVRFELGDLTLESEAFTVVPLEPLSEFVGRDVHGILGRELLQRFVVDLDYRAGRLTLFEPGSVTLPDELAVLPVRFQWHHACLPFRIRDEKGEWTTGEAVLDTGSQETLSITRGFFDDARFDERFPKRVPSVGRSAGGETQGVRFRAASVEILGHRFDACPVGANLSMGRLSFDAVVGGSVLHRFRLVLDYPNGRIALAPRADVVGPAVRDRAGFFATSPRGRDGSREPVVFDVLPGSPAAEAGLLPGDRLQAVDDRPAGSLTLWDVGRLGRGPEGARIRLRVVRDGRTRTVELVLREYL